MGRRRNTKEEERQQRLQQEMMQQQQQQMQQQMQQHLQQMQETQMHVQQRTLQQPSFTQQQIFTATATGASAQQQQHRGGIMHTSHTWQQQHPSTWSSREGTSTSWSPLPPLPTPPQPPQPLPPPQPPQPPPLPPPAAQRTNQPTEGAAARVTSIELAPPNGGQRMAQKRRAPPATVGSSDVSPDGRSWYSDGSQEYFRTGTATSGELGFNVQGPSFANTRQQFGSLQQMPPSTSWAPANQKKGSQKEKQQCQSSEISPNWGGGLPTKPILKAGIQQQGRNIQTGSNQGWQQQGASNFPVQQDAARNIFGQQECARNQPGQSGGQRNFFGQGIRRTSSGDTLPNFSPHTSTSASPQRGGFHFQQGIQQLYPQFQNQESTQPQQSKSVFGFDQNQWVHQGQSQRQPSNQQVTSTPNFPFPRAEISSSLPQMPNNPFNNPVPTSSIGVRPNPIKQANPNMSVPPPPYQKQEQFFNQTFPGGNFFQEPRPENPSHTGNVQWQDRGRGVNQRHMFTPQRNTQSVPGFSFQSQTRPHQHFGPPQYPTPFPRARFPLPLGPRHASLHERPFFPPAGRGCLEEANQAAGVDLASNWIPSNARGRSRGGRGGAGNRRPRRTNGGHMGNRRGGRRGGGGDGGSVASSESSSRDSSSRLSASPSEDFYIVEERTPNTRRSSEATEPGICTSLESLTFAGLIPGNNPPLVPSTSLASAFPTEATGSGQGITAPPVETQFPTTQATEISFEVSPTENPQDYSGIEEHPASTENTPTMESFCTELSLPTDEGPEPDSPTVSLGQLTQPPSPANFIDVKAIEQSVTPVDSPSDDTSSLCTVPDIEETPHMVFTYDEARFALFSPCSDLLYNYFHITKDTDITVKSPIDFGSLEETPRDSSPSFSLSLQSSPAVNPSNAESNWDCGAQSRTQESCEGMSLSSGCDFAASSAGDSFPGSSRASGAPSTSGVPRASADQASSRGRGSIGTDGSLASTSGGSCGVIPTKPSPGKEPCSKKAKKKHSSSGTNSAPKSNSENESATADSTSSPFGQSSAMGVFSPIHPASSSTSPGLNSIHLSNNGSSPRSAFDSLQNRRPGKPSTSSATDHFRSDSTVRVPLESVRNADHMPPATSSVSSQTASEGAPAGGPLPAFSTTFHSHPSASITSARRGVFSILDVPPPDPDADLSEDKILEDVLDMQGY